MKLELPFGKASISADFRTPRRCAKLIPKNIATLQKPEHILNQALAKPLGSYQLEQSFGNAGRVGIVVADDLHNSGGEIFLPLVLERLYRLGIQARDISVLVGGEWGAQQNGVAALLGSPDSHGRRPRVYYHDCNDANNVAYVGQTRRGTPVFVNRLLLDVDMTIMCGTIRHDPFAGYSGGPSLVLPNCVGSDTLERHFSHSLDSRDGRLHPACLAGVVQGNPIQEDRREAFRCITTNFALHTVLNTRGQMIGAYAGEPLQSYAAGCHLVDDLFRVPISELADIVIVSCDSGSDGRNFREAYRALHHAMRAVEPGGVIILIAECIEGLGSVQLQRWFEQAESLGVNSSNAHNRDGLIAMSTWQKAHDFNVIMVTSLDGNLVQRMGFRPATDLDQAIRTARSLRADLNSCYVIPDGNATVPYLT